MSDLVFRSTDMGEECKCNRCSKLGYGRDAWHPCTNDFWPERKGRLSYYQCRACKEEVKRGLKIVMA